MIVHVTILKFEEIQTQTHMIHVFSKKNYGEHVESCEKVTDKVHFILKSLDICAFLYDDELNELRDTISELSES